MGMYHLGKCTHWKSTWKFNCTVKYNNNHLKVAKGKIVQALPVMHHTIITTLSLDI